MESWLSSTAMDTNQKISRTIASAVDLASSFINSKGSTMAAGSNDLTKEVKELKGTRDSLLAQLECPVCLETCLPPIYMCRNGHNVCSNCRPQVNDCPTCREPGRPDIKNRFAESFSEQFTTDCTFKKYGCQSLILKNKLDEHVLDCLYRYRCRECSEYYHDNGYHGDILRLSQHLAAEHSPRYSVGDKCESVLQVQLKPGCATMIIRYLFCHDMLFRCMFSSRNKKLRVCAMFFGPRKNAGDFSVWMKFISEDAAFKISYRAPCFPWDKQFLYDDCVVVIPETLKRLKRKDDALLCQIKIRRTDGANAVEPDAHLNHFQTVVDQD